MLLIVSIKTIMLHAGGFLATHPLLELPLTVAGGEICHSEKLLGADLQRKVAGIIRSAPRAITEPRMMSSAPGVCRRRVSRAGFRERSDGMTLLIETPAESFEVRERAASFEVRQRVAPVSVQSDTPSVTIPRAYLASNRAAPIPNEKAVFCDGHHGKRAAIAVV
jgi:hypothetical protein